MKRRQFNSILGTAGALLTAGLPATAKSAETWNLTANVAEACTCEIPCPCNFGRPTKELCQGSRLIEITDGHIGNMDLAGISFLVTFTMGDWAKVYVDDQLSGEQRLAFDAIYSTAFAGFKKIARTLEYAAISIEKDERTIRFAVPDSEVEISMMLGLDKGPIRVSNLPSAAYHEYVQYESVVHKHTSDLATWSHKGTNGFTSVMRATGSV